MALLEASGIGKNFGDTKVFTTPASGLHRLMEPKATTRPSGSANSRVRANSSQLSRNAPERRPKITDTGTHPSHQIFQTVNRLALSGAYAPALPKGEPRTQRQGTCLPLWGRWHCASNDGEGEDAKTNVILFISQSARARSYFSASACMVPSAFSSSKAASTAAAASLPLRKATPYSSAFSSSTIARLA